MIKLKKIICYLDQEVYKSLEEELEKSKAISFLYLIQAYRHSEVTDIEIAEALGVSPNSLYVLKSHLNDKIRQHLPGDLFLSGEQILRQLQQIDEVCLGNNRETAIAFLKRLETHLLVNDMHPELLIVYSALKKMHLYSEKYFQYSQLYNQQVAFNFSLDKCEELLGSFNYMLGQYNFSRSPKILKTLLFLDMQVREEFELNPSRQTEIIMNILQLQLRIFTPVQNNDNNTESILTATQHLVTKLPDGSPHKKWIHPINFLAFEYYHRSGQEKTASDYFSKVDGKLDTILLYSDISITSLFLVSRLNYLNGRETIRQPERLLYDPHDTHTSINVAIYHAMIAYFRNDYKDATNKLSAIINTNSFKDFFHINAELKLTLAYIHIKMHDYNLADSLMRSVVRKIKSDSSLDYPNVINIINVFNSEIRQTNANQRTRQKNWFLLFLDKNTGDKELLTWLLPELKVKYAQGSHTS